MYVDLQASNVTYIYVEGKKLMFHGSKMGRLGITRNFRVANKIFLTCDIVLILII